VDCLGNGCKVAGGFHLPDRVDDGQQIRYQARIHALLLRLQDDIVEGQEQAPEEHEVAQHQKRKSGLLEAGEVLPDHQRPRSRRQPRPDRQRRDAAQHEHQEGDGAHGPGEPDGGDHAVHHDGQDDAAERRAADHNAEGGGAALEEPGHDAVHAGGEEGVGPDGADDGLGEEELVVLRREGHHHQAEDVDDCAAEQHPPRTVGVEDPAELVFARRHVSGLC
jgi:hypothetical protein